LISFNIASSFAPSSKIWPNPLKTLKYLQTSPHRYSHTYIHAPAHNIPMHSFDKHRLCPHRGWPLGGAGNYLMCTHETPLKFTVSLLFVFLCGSGLDLGTELFTCFHMPWGWKSMHYEIQSWVQVLAQQLRYCGTLSAVGL
jgi:hypothetical protein